MDPKAFLRDMAGQPAIFSRDLGTEIEARVGDVYKRVGKEDWAALPIWDGPFPPVREKLSSGWYIEAYLEHSRRAEWHVIVSSIDDAGAAIRGGQAAGIKLFRILEPLDDTDSDRRQLLQMGDVRLIQ